MFGEGLTVDEDGQVTVEPCDPQGRTNMVYINEPVVHYHAPELTVISTGTSTVSINF